VDVVSVLGQGSEFVVRLPVVPAAELHPPDPTESGKPAGRALRILVVDDNVDMAETLAMLLEESGHQVRMAHDGPTALEAALADRPNVVFLDVGLPGLNGFEVAKRIRQRLDSQNIMLIAVTGYGHEKDRQRSQEAGFDHHLVKPVDFDKVQQILASVFEKAT
jgi:CheY-like chemotaxis protein